MPNSTPTQITDHEFTIAWALAKSEMEPAHRRIRILRGIAEVCGAPKEREELHALASRLEEADLRCCEFRLGFESRIGR